MSSMAPVGIYLRCIGARARNGAWLGALLGALDSINTIKSSPNFGKTRVLVEGSAVCALAGALAGLGIGIISLIVTEQRRRTSKSLAPSGSITHAQTFGFLFGGTTAFGLFLCAQRALERVMIERLHSWLLLGAIGGCIAAALLLAHWSEPVFRVPIARVASHVQVCRVSKATRFAIIAVAPIVVTAVPLLATFGLSLGVLRRPLLFLVFLVLERWVHLVARSHSARSVRRGIGTITPFIIISAGRVLMSGGGDTPTFGNAIFLADAMEVFQHFTNWGWVRVAHATQSAQPRFEIRPKFSRRGKFSERPLNVIWYIVDSLRADHLRLYGYRLETSPTLTQLGGDSLVFERTYSQSSTTALSIPSMLSGRDPGNMHWSPEAWPVASADNFYVSRLFRDSGYSTVLVTNQWVREKIKGMQHGFEQILNAPQTVNWRSGDYVLMNLFQVIETASRTDRPLFAVAHVDDVHHPYISSAGRAVPEYSSGITSEYDRAIAVFDQGLRLLIEKLRFERLWDNTVLVVTADHGEEFGEHGGAIHSRTCYDEVTHVPLIIHVPNTGAMRIGARVALVDIVPTLIELLGKKDGDEILDGQSLFVPTFEPEAVDPNRLIFCAIPQMMSGRPQFFLRSVRNGTWSLFEEAYTSRLELYDSRSDIREKTDIARSNASTAAQLRSYLVRLNEDELYRATDGRSP